MRFRVTFQYNDKVVEVSTDNPVKDEEVKCVLNLISEQVVDFIKENKAFVILPIGYTFKISEGK